jgi:hypothetical protein
LECSGEGDEIFILNLLKDFFLMRGYEVLSYSNPTTASPLYGDEGEEVVK